MDALHRTTREYFRLVNPDYFPTSTYIRDPDLSAVVGLPTKYWIITGNIITAMTQGERDAVDAAEVVAQRDALAALLERPNALARACAEVVLDEINILRATQALPARTLAQFRNAVRTKLDG